ncbi:MAG: hypothetical protein LBE37_14575 [Sphingobacterium sp.]|nr:hypothetical protein [Sphingobacterium sp.]
MNRKLTIFLIAVPTLFSMRLLIAQEMLKVDYEEIERQLQDKNKDSYYPKIKLEYDANRFLRNYSG